MPCICPWAQSCKRRVYSFYVSIYPSIHPSVYKNINKYIIYIFIYLYIYLLCYLFIFMCVSKWGVRFWFQNGYFKGKNGHLILRHPHISFLLLFDWLPPDWLLFSGSTFCIRSSWAVAKWDKRSAASRKLPTSRGTDTLLKKPVNWKSTRSDSTLRSGKSFWTCSQRAGDTANVSHLHIYIYYIYISINISNIIYNIYKYKYIYRSAQSQVLSHRA